jgi:putative ABC transport system permease protein
MSIFQDLRFALRMMRKNPGFSAIAILALGLGIGANNTVFTLVNTILLKSLPFKDGQEIVHLGCNDLSRGAGSLAVSYPDFADWKAQARSFHGIAAFSTGTMNVSDEGGVPERLSGAWLTANAFSLVELSPILGRDFLPIEDQRNAQPVVLLGYGVWQSRYGGNPQIVGKTIRVNAIPATVIGVMSQGMKFPFDAELWMPLIQTPNREARDNRDLLVFGRLRKGLSTAQARAELIGITGRLAQEYPNSNKGIGAEVMSFNERYNSGEIEVVLWIMMGAVGFVLLIACVNVANLLLSRAVYRSREICVRASVGAGRWRIIRQLLMESILLALAGGIVGLAISLAGVRWFHLSLTNANIEGMPYWLDFSMDWKVFGYLLAVCFATSILFGLVPALRATKFNLAEGLKESGRGSGDGSRSGRLASALVVAQLTLTLILLAGAGMMIQDFLRSQKVSLGVSPENVLTMRLRLPENKYSGPADQIDFHEKLAQRLLTTPGIQSIGVTSNLPLDGSPMATLRLEGQESGEKNKLPRVRMVTIGPGYLETLGVNLLRGRPFHARDGAPGSESVIVNERFASRYWPHQDAIGKRINLSLGTDAPWLTVVGVIPHVVQHMEKYADIESITYIPYRQAPARALSVIVRTLVPPSSLVQAVRREVQAVDPDLPLYRVRTMGEHLAQNLWPYRVFGSLFGAFAFISLALSAVGIYGVTAYAAGQRTQEIGVRMALGADRRDVLWLMLRQGLRQLLAGLALGLIGALTVGKVLEGLLLETKATDPASNLIGMSVLCAITLLACLVPAWKASRLEPLSALRRRP